METKTTKKMVADFIKSRGGKCAYSGNTRTMHIKGENAQRIERETINQFAPDIPFNLLAQ